MSKPNSSRLSQEQIAEIRARYRRGDVSAGIVKLAAEYGVSKSMISLIVRGEVHKADGVVQAPPRAKKIERACAICGAAFKAKPCEIQRGGGIYCSTDCFHKDQSRPLADRRSLLGEGRQERPRACASP